MFNNFSWIIIIITLIYVFTWLLQHKIIPSFVLKKLKKSLNLSTLNTIQQLKQAYSRYNGARISKKAARAHGVDTREFTYGEIVFESFYPLLITAEVSDQDIFIDLGSGTGKAVIATALLTNAQQTIGLEYLDELNQVGRNIADNLNLTQRTQFITGNFYTYNLSQATLIFINATALTESQWLQLAHHLNTVTSGTRIIVTSHQLHAPKFKLKQSSKVLMSWGLVSCRVYQKI